MIVDFRGATSGVSTKRAGEVCLHQPVLLAEGSSGVLKPG
jgi:hypothetical protein